MYNNLIDLSNLDLSNLLPVLNQSYFVLGLSYGSASSDFFFDLSYSLTSCNHPDVISSLLLSGLVLLAVPISIVLGGTGKLKFKLYKQRRALHEKHKSYFNINFKLNMITAGPYAGKFILKDSNSIAGFAVNSLGNHPSIGLYQVGPDLVWGILAMPSNNSIFFEISTRGINRVGTYKVLYENRVLVLLPNYSDNHSGHGVLTVS